MTKKVENKRVHEVIETPVNDVKTTSFLTNVTYLNKADEDTERANVKALSKCNDIVQDFKGWTKQNLSTKYQKLCNDSGIFFKAKKVYVCMRKTALNWVKRQVRLLVLANALLMTVK